MIQSINHLLTPLRREEISFVLLRNQIGRHVHLTSEISHLPSHNVSPALRHTFLTPRGGTGIRVGDVSERLRADPRRAIRINQVYLLRRPIMFSAMQKGLYMV